MNRKMNKILPAALVAVVVVSCGRLFQLEPPWLVLCLTGGMVLCPFWQKYRRMGKQQKERFQEFSVYMEQMTYSFFRQQKVLDALEETKVLFPEGEVHDAIAQATEQILHDYESENCVEEALAGIEQVYPSEHMHTMHTFLRQIEDIGGEYVSILQLLQQDREVWVEQTMLLEDTCNKSRRNVVIAMCITLLVCLSTGFIMPAETGVEHLLLYQITTTLFLLSQLLILVLMEKRITRNLCQTAGEDETDIAVKYQRYCNYQESRERRHSLRWSVLPAVLLVISASLSLRSITYVSVILFAIMLFQHKIGHFLLERELKKKIKRAFPRWLMEVSLLIQTENVQVSLDHSREDAPQILQGALKKMTDQLIDDPESIAPYLDFLKEFQLVDVTSAMKMLYAISQGGETMADSQIAELITRNHALLEQEQSAENEGKMAGMYLYLLIPALLGAFKLMADMTLFLLMFLQQAHVG